MKNKLLAIFEVLGVLVIGWTLTKVFISILNVPSLQIFLEDAIKNKNPDFLYLAKIGFITLFIQFLCLIIPAILLTKILHNKSYIDMGVTIGNISLKENLLSGVALFCFLGIPMKLFLIINQSIDLGTQPDYWELFNKEWNLGFWIFMAVGSFIVIPVFEEIFYRGYAQFRLEKEFKIIAVFMVSFIFVSSHFQYYILDLFNMSMLLVLFMLAMGMAVSRYSSGSIIPAIIIHAMMNIPTKLPYDFIMLFIMILGAVVLRKYFTQIILDFNKKIKSINLIKDIPFFLVIFLFAIGFYYVPKVSIVLFSLFFIISLTLQLLAKKKLPAK